MNTTINPARSGPRPRGRTLIRALAGGALLAGLVTTGTAQIIDPDPELFDGSDTKVEEPPQQDVKVVVDDWEGPNLIVYDASEQGPGRGGTGYADGTAPGLDIGTGIPGIPGLPGLPIPMGGGAGGESEAQPQMAAGGAESTPGTPKQSANIAGAAQSMTPPSDVQIGDPSQQIASQGMAQAGNMTGRPEGGEEGSRRVGEDTTKIPQAAATQQSGTRGGGVEQGDAMPTDM